MSKKEAEKLLQNSFDFKILSGLRPDSLLWVELQNFKKDTLTLSNFRQVESHKIFDTKRNISYKLVVFGSFNRIFLFLVSNSNLVLGYREAEIKNTNGSCTSDGSIHILAQGFGLSSVIEHFFEYYMNTWSLQVGKPISHTVEDENIKDLQKLETALELAVMAQDIETALALSSQLKDKRLERMAWERLYGAGGKFGTRLVRGKLVRVFDGITSIINAPSIVTKLNDHQDVNEKFDIKELLESIEVPS